MCERVDMMSVSKMFRLLDLFAAVVFAAGPLMLWLGWQPDLKEIAFVAFIGAMKAFIGSRSEDERQ
jgi:hypothetical protein